MGELQCPRCVRGLVRRTYQGLTLDRCAGCGGAWAEDPAVRRLAETGEISFTDEESRHIQAVLRKPESHGPGLSCPACGRSMDRLALEGTATVLDRCNGHGTWFDVGEIQEFQVWRESGSASVASRPPDRGPWDCPGCGERLQEMFHVCWNCLTDRMSGKTLPGVERQVYDEDAARRTKLAQERVREWLRVILPAAAVLCLAPLDVRLPRAMLRSSGPRTPVQRDPGLGGPPRPFVVKLRISYILGLAVFGMLVYGLSIPDPAIFLGDNIGDALGFGMILFGIGILMLFGFVASIVYAGAAFIHALRRRISPWWPIGALLLNIGSVILIIVSLVHGRVWPF